MSVIDRTALAAAAQRLPTCTSQLLIVKNCLHNTAQRATTNQYACAADDHPLVNVTSLEVVPLEVLCAALHASRILHQAVHIVPANSTHE
jgi:hypothetical protein